jgi:type III restriction enzyme
MFKGGKTEPPPPPVDLIHIAAIPERQATMEISGTSKDKAEKKWFVENRWIPVVNALKDKYGYPEWHFIELANYI